jgi:hypothetical protein
VSQDEYLLIGPKNQASAFCVSGNAYALFGSLLVEKINDTFFGRFSEVTY